MRNLDFVADDSYAEALRSSLPAEFLNGRIPLDPEGRYTRRKCVVDHCTRVSTRTGIDFCRPHGEGFDRASESDYLTWASAAQPHKLTRPIRAYIDLGDADGTLLGAELAFGIMKRGERDQPCSLPVVRRLATVLSGRRVHSLLDLRYDQVALEGVVDACGGYANTRSFLLDALDEVCGLAGLEPTRRYLGLASAGRGAFANLNPIANEEFRASVERWMSYRLDSELGAPQYVQAVVSHLQLFCGWLDDQGVGSWASLTRQHLLDFLAFFNKAKKTDGTPYSPKYRRAVIGNIAVFIDEASVNEWAAVPPSARWMRNERPKVPTSDPRLIGSSAAARLRSPGNLRLIADLDCRLVIRIIAETGLRRKDVCNGISLDSLLEAESGKWSLRYLNSKTNEICWAPIELGLAEAINEHIARKRAQFPNARMLFTVTDTGRVITLTVINRVLHEYARELDLRGKDGNYLLVTPHMFRHQNATDWLESGMSIPQVQKLLGQKSMRTTEIYARVSERSARDAWEKTRAVNSDGQVITSKSGELAEAAWAHAFMGGATQALPNGRCGMPCSETCEHANACLFCPLFLTTPEYLPVLREQRDEHRVMMELAEREGHQRIVEKNQKPFFALNKLIEKLEGIEAKELVGSGAGR